MTDRHDWNSWDHYLQIHSGRLADYDYFVILNDLDYEVKRPFVVWTGSLYCLSDIRVDVEKRLDIDVRNGRIFVKTTRYKYHARYVRANRNLLRYDNAHVHPNHPDKHHMHLYDLPAGHPQEPEGRVVHVGEDGWPTLSDFLDEVIERFHGG